MEILSCHLFLEKNSKILSQKVILFLAMLVMRKSMVNRRAKTGTLQIDDIENESVSNLAVVKVSRNRVIFIIY